jgi:broad specificity phosphatase PhoE
VKLLLARHGQSTWNSLRRFQGIADVPLSDVGRAQARALGHAVRRHRITRAYVSPLRRAAETAELALAGSDVEIVTMPDLRELSLGAWEGCTVTEIRAQDGDPYRAWLRAPVDCPPPEGEALHDVCTRMLGVVEQIEAVHRPDDDVLIVAHGGVISVYACHLLGCSFNSLWRLRVDNASLTVVAPPRVVTLNDTSHLPGDLRPAHLQRLEIVTGAEVTGAGRPADGSPAP